MPEIVTKKYHLNPKGIWVIFVLASLLAFVSISVDLLTPILPVLTEAFDTSANSIKMIIPAFFVGFGFSHLFWGSLSDRLGRRKILISGLIIYCLATLGCIFAGNLTELLLSRFLQGVGGAAGVILSRAVIRDIYGASQATKAMSTLLLIFVPIPIVTPIVAGYVITHFDWIAIFWIMEISGLIALVLITLLLAETAPIKSVDPADSAVSKTDEFLSIVKNYFFLKNAVANTLCFGGLLIFVTNLSYFLTSHYNFSSQQVGIAFSLFSAALATGTYLVRVAVPRLGVEKTLYAGLCMMFLGWLCIMITYSMELELLDLLTIGMIVACIGMAVVMTLTPGQAMVPFSTNSGAASSIYGIFQYGGGTLMLLLASSIQGEGFLYVGIIATVSAFLALISYQVLGSRKTFAAV